LEEERAYLEEYIRSHNNQLGHAYYGNHPADAATDVFERGLQLDLVHMAESTACCLAIGFFLHLLSAEARYPMAVSPEWTLPTSSARALSTPTTALKLATICKCHCVSTCEGTRGSCIRLVRKNVSQPRTDCVHRLVSVVENIIQMLIYCCANTGFFCYNGL
jgi:hypothetical protein